EIDLSGFDGSGFAPDPAPGQLDSDDWSVRLSDISVLDFGGAGGGGGTEYGRGSSPGDVDSPGVWAFDVDGAGTIALGIQPSDSTFTPGEIKLRVVNDTGVDIPAIQIEYTVWFRNDVERSSWILLQQSPDDATYTPVGNPIDSPGAPDDNGFVADELVELITFDPPLADGAQYYLEWAGDDVPGGSGPRDEFGIEGITLRLLGICGNGLADEGEECDDGLMNLDTAACTTTCTMASCGDGFVHAGVETCDDGNTDPGDGCAADCTTEGEPGSSSSSSGAADTSAGEGGSGSASGSGGDASATAASASASATATAGGESSGSGGTDESTGGQDDGTGGCGCNGSGSGSGPWPVLAVVGLSLARRRRRRR
ncbi:MAG: DUF4215 domain-containing protein, partial [Nannocystaceae bacterium]|nr:DUF4215 domain-containing protein [Nannocystaceae bacterium]